MQNTYKSLYSKLTINLTKDGSNYETLKRIKTIIEAKKGGTLTVQLNLINDEYETTITTPFKASLEDDLKKQIETITTDATLTVN
ncbi:hypothetical protein MCHI_000872 [Candidatus Magnetoovum chiemensis]|nr:hypothetical protein MCHI_000872 [Candidatus Magnetoovum chiemensis]